MNFKLVQPTAYLIFRWCDISTWISNRHSNFTCWKLNSWSVFLNISPRWSSPSYLNSNSTLLNCLGHKPWHNSWLLFLTFPIASLRKSVSQLRDTSRIWPLLITSTATTLVQAIYLSPGLWQQPINSSPYFYSCSPPPTTVYFYQSSQSNTFKMLSQILSILYIKLSSGFLSLGKNQSPFSVLTRSSVALSSLTSSLIFFPLISSAPATPLFSLMFLKLVKYTPGFCT